MESPAVRRELPCIPLRESVLFPCVVVPYFVGRPRSLASIARAMDADREVVIVCQRDSACNDPGLAELHPVGTRARIIQLLKLPDGLVKILVEGLERVRLVSADASHEWLAVDFEGLPLATEPGGGPPSVREREATEKLRTRWEAERRDFEAGMARARSAPAALELAAELVPFAVREGEDVGEEWRHGDVEGRLVRIAELLQRRICAKVPDPLYIDPRTEFRVRRLLDLYVPEAMVSLDPGHRCRDYPASATPDVRSFLLAMMTVLPRLSQVVLEAPDAESRFAFIASSLDPTSST